MQEAPLRASTERSNPEGLESGTEERPGRMKDACGNSAESAMTRKSVFIIKVGFVKIRK